MLSNHREQAIKSVSCAVVTISDTRVKETDGSGKKIIELLQREGHQVQFYKIVRDEKEEIKLTLQKLLHHSLIQVIIFNGGTGLSNRDVTIESIEPYFDKELPGFGELFRNLSYKFDIGTASILSRATAGIGNNRAIFSIPGSTGAVTLAMERIILPELGHIVMEINKDL